MRNNEALQMQPQNINLKSGKVVFRRSLEPEHSTNREVLFAFHELIKTQPIGTWLIRESRTVGMISVTVHAESGVQDYRFGLIDDRWVDLSDHQNIEVQHISDRFFLFMLLIPEYLSLDEQKLYLPELKYASTDESFSNYIIHDNPFPHLKMISDRLYRIVNHFRKDVSLKENELLIEELLKIAPSLNEDQLFNAFEDWLEKTALLTRELTCPIEKRLFKLPCLISESLWVYEKSALDELKKLNRLSQCPATSKEIKKAPLILTNYTRELANRSLPLFKEAVELCHQAKKEIQFFTSFFAGKAKELKNELPNTDTALGIAG